MATDAENLPLGPEGLGQRVRVGSEPCMGLMLAPHTMIPILHLFTGICLFVSSELLEHIPTIGQGVLY